MKRLGQPAELATTYVMLANPLSSYVSGATAEQSTARPRLPAEQSDWERADVRIASPVAL
jgi:NAD(P)-dependent dehydrogenase (short-subunit alcohol dehydrogenase family)